LNTAGASHQKGVSLPKRRAAQKLAALL